MIFRDHLIELLKIWFVCWYLDFVSHWKSIFQGQFDLKKPWPLTLLLRTDCVQAIDSYGWLQQTGTVLTTPCMHTRLCCAS